MESRQTEWGRNVTNYNENMAKTSTFWKSAGSALMVQSPKFTAFSSRNTDLKFL